MDDFEKQIHAMFDHIWDCEIDHPVFQDTVGELMGAVIQCYKSLPSAQPEVRFEEQTIKGYSIDQLILIANVLERENLPPERVAEALTDMQRVIAMVQSEFKELLRQSVKWFMEDDLK